MKTFEVEVPAGGLPVVKLSQKGTTLAVRVAEACNVEKKTKVSRTTTRERVNQQPGKDWAVGGTGIVLAGVGAGVIVDAQSNVYSNDTTSRQYNKVGPTNATLIGAGLAAGGLALVAVAVADGIRASGEEVETGEVDLDGEVIKKRVRCSDRPAADRPIKLRVSRYAGMGRVGAPGTNEEMFDLGRTDGDGLLKVKLEVALSGMEPTFVEGPGVLLLDDNEVGQVDLAPVVGHKEQQAWELLDRRSCSEPTSSRSCEDVTRFLQEHRHGNHAAEAQQLLDQARPKLDAFRDDEMWAKSESEACAKAPKLDDVNEIARACAKVKTYVNFVAKGRRAAEAQKLLKAADARVERLKRDAEKEAEAEAKAERAKELKQCKAQCKMICSNWRFKFDACYSGCVQKDCEQ
ncbi:MAG: hypothetical protein KF718_02445 [Polyangiaceae bacterium]|nr:hypothetical protein [Polyangiaceae bacterium]